MTIGLEATAKMKQIATASTKAITWLRVSADIAAPTDRNAPAISRQPR